MRELIISNFLRKYLSSSVDEAFLKGPAYARLTDTLAQHIDAYLARNQQRSVRDLEEQLRQLADAHRGLPANTPQLFLRQQRQAHSTKHAKTEAMNKTTGPKAMRDNLMIEVPGFEEAAAGVRVSQTPGEDPALATVLRLKMGVPIKHNNPLAATQFVGKRAHSSLLGDFGKDWGEVTRYHHARDELAVKQERDLALTKKQQVRSVLDGQLREQAAEQARQLEERKRYETQLLERCRQELEEEKRRAAERKAKLQRESEQRDRELEALVKDKT